MPKIGSSDSGHIIFLKGYVRASQVQLPGLSSLLHVHRGLMCRIECNRAWRPARSSSAFGCSTFCSTARRMASRPSCWIPFLFLKTGKLRVRIMAVWNKQDPWIWLCVWVLWISCVSRDTAIERRRVCTWWSRRVWRIGHIPFTTGFVSLKSVM